MDSEDIRPVEIEVSGETIYREKIKALVEPAENGKFVVIDVESGDYEIDEDALTASTRPARATPSRCQLRDTGRLSHRLQPGRRAWPTPCLGDYSTTT